MFYFSFPIPSISFFPCTLFTSFILSLSSFFPMHIFLSLVIPPPVRPHLSPCLFPQQSSFLPLPHLSSPTPYFNFTQYAYSADTSQGSSVFLHWWRWWCLWHSLSFSDRGWLSMAGLVLSLLCLKTLWTLWSAASGPGRLTKGQTATNTPEMSYSNLPCVFSQSSNTGETERGEREREREATKAHVKEHKAFTHPGSLIDGCREWVRRWER